MTPIAPPWQRPNPAALGEQCYAAAYQALERDELSKARALFTLLTLLEPRTERAWVGLAVAHERAGQLAAATTLYALGERAVSETSAWLALGRGRTLLALGRELEANAAFDAAEAATHEPQLLSVIQEARCP